MMHKKCYTGYSLRVMSQKLLLLLFFVIAGNMGFGQKLKVNDITTIKSILHLQQGAWNNGNLDSFMLFYWNSPELRFVSKKGVNKGWQQVYDNYKKTYANSVQMGKLNFEVKSTELIDKTNALVIGSWEVINDTGIHSGYFSLWFKKIGSKWLIVVDHTS